MAIDEKKLIESLRPWLIGQTVEDVSYEHGVLAMRLSNRKVLLCSTSVVAQGIAKAGK